MRRERVRVRRPHEWLGYAFRPVRAPAPEAYAFLSRNTPNRLTCKFLASDAFSLLTEQVATRSCSVNCLPSWLSEPKKPPRTAAHARVPKEILPRLRHRWQILSALRLHSLLLPSISFEFRLGWEECRSVL